jgi:hypothetical protein
MISGTDSHQVTRIRAGRDTCATFIKDFTTLTRGAVLRQLWGRPTLLALIAMLLLS